MDAGCIEDLLPDHAGYAGGFRAYRVCRVTDSEFSKYPGIAAIANPDQSQLSTAPINLDANEPLSAFPLLFVFISKQCRSALRCLEDIVVDKLTLTNFQADHELIRWEKLNAQLIYSTFCGSLAMEDAKVARVEWKITARQHFLFNQSAVEISWKTLKGVYLKCVAGSKR